METASHGDSGTRVPLTGSGNRQSGFDLSVLKDFLNDAPWEPGECVLGERMVLEWGQ
jgi:hypothetical protein